MQNAPNATPSAPNDLPKKRLAWSEVALAITSGLLYALAFPGLEQAYLAWICITPLLVVLDRRNHSWRQVLQLGWISGWTLHLMSYTWLIGMLEKFGQLPTVLALIAYGLLTLAQSSLFGAFALAYRALRQRTGLQPLWAAPIVMVLCEWVYPALFPSYLANTQYAVLPFVQIVSITGVLGLSFLLTQASAIVAQAILARRNSALRPSKLGLGFFLLCFVATGTYGASALEAIESAQEVPEEAIRVGLVQTNMGIFQKRDNPQKGVKRHHELSLELEKEGVDLLVWPESGFHFPIPTGTTNLKRPVLGRLRTPLLFGGLRYQVVDAEAEDYRLFNTAYLLDDLGHVQGTYDKTYLLAFGEYLPLGDMLPFLYKLSPNTGRFERGSHTKPLKLNDINYGILICYEDILPRFVQDVMAHKPDILVNLTNDAWFGKTREPRIHLALAIFRAAEHRRYLVRSTNSGISAIVGPSGRILQETPLFESATLIGRVWPRDDVTFYARFGDWVGWFCVLAGLVAALRRRGDHPAAA